MFFFFCSEDKLLQQDLIDLIPLVEEANAMSEELNRRVKFEIKMLSATARGLHHGRTEVSLDFNVTLCVMLLFWTPGIQRWCCHMHP